MTLLIRSTSDQNDIALLTTFFDHFRPPGSTFVVLYFDNNFGLYFRLPGSTPWTKISIRIASSVRLPSPPLSPSPLSPLVDRPAEMISIWISVLIPDTKKYSIVLCYLALEAMRMEIFVQGVDPGGLKWSQMSPEKQCHSDHKKQSPSYQYYTYHHSHTVFMFLIITTF